MEHLNEECINNILHKMMIQNAKIINYELKCESMHPFLCNETVRKQGTTCLLPKPKLETFNNIQCNAWKDNI